MKGRPPIVSYSLWLPPAEALAARLQLLINELAARYGTPRFQPHLTLVSRVHNSSDVLQALAESTEPFEVIARGVATGTTYYQSVFVDIEPGESLLDLHARAVAAMGASSPGVFRPHLSLAYGISDPSLREEIACRTASDGLFRFRAASLSLVDTSGHPEDWRTLAEVALGRPA